MSPSVKTTDSSRPARAGHHRAEGSDTRPGDDAVRRYRATSSGRVGSRTTATPLLLAHRRSTQRSGPNTRGAAGAERHRPVAPSRASASLAQAT